jgi:hypothetical protein
VGEVEHVHDPEDQRQPHRDGEQQHAEGDPVDDGDEVVVQPGQRTPSG